MSTARANRSGLRTLLAGLAVALLTFVGVPSAVAAEGDTGSISGTVLHASDGIPVEGATVELRDAAGFAIQTTWTAFNGTYTFWDVPADAIHSVRFDGEDQGLVEQYFPGKRTYGEAADVVVAAGEDLTGIDAELITGGSISGTVISDADGSPVPYATISILGRDGYSTATGTDADGLFHIDAVHPGDYDLRFYADGFLSEYYNDALVIEDAQAVTVVGGEETDGVDISLAVGSAISGTVTKASDGSPLAGVSVTAWSDTTSESAVTQDDGTYFISNLRAGSYTVSFDSSDPTLLDEYWDSATDAGAATAVEVIAGDVHPGIDATLDDAAVISGHVTRAADGEPATGTVAVVDERGFAFTEAVIDEQGAYTAYVPAGAYGVRFSPDDPSLLAEFWDDARSLNDMTMVAVSAGEVRDDIDAQLEAGAPISGTVTSGGVPVSGITVTAWGDTVTQATTDAQGAYTLYVPFGTYTVEAGGVAEDGTYYARQYFDGALFEEDAALVEVEAAGAEDVDFALSAGADIRGEVFVDGGIDQEGEGLSVIAYLWTDGAWREADRAPSWGTYDFSGWGQQLPGRLPAGTYTIGVEGAECTTYLGGGTSLDDAERIELEAGEVHEGADIAIAECGLPLPATLTLSADSARAGDELTVSGGGFVPGESVRLELHSTPIALTTLVADEAGEIAGSITIPTGAAVGEHDVVAIGVFSDREASAALTVLATSGGGSGGEGTDDGLASTGTDLPIALSALAAMLAVAGVVLLVRRRNGALS
ncbi:MSCRAMM family protein [Microbacterium sp. NPDC055903]